MRHLLSDLMIQDVLIFWLVKNICGLTPVPEVCQAYDTAISEGFLPS
ncbi:MAG: hypothetical protein ACYCQI_04850 [Gammaproteobacteria bacterium]